MTVTSVEVAVVVSVELVAGVEVVSVEVEVACGELVESDVISAGATTSGVDVETDSSVGATTTGVLSGAGVTDRAGVEVLAVSVTIGAVVVSFSTETGVTATGVLSLTITVRVLVAWFPAPSIAV